MITKLRLRTATLIMWIGAHVAPKEMRPILLNILDGWAGIPDQQHQGKTGGIMMAPWWVNIAGENLARTQMLECGLTAAAVRERMEKPKRPFVRDDSAYLFSPGGLELPVKPHDGPWTYERTIDPLPEQYWRAADPAKAEDTEDSLNTEFCNWCGEQGLEWVCAEELLLREDLLPEQRCYLHAFIERFEATIARESLPTSTSASDTVSES